MFTIITSANNT